MDEKIQKEMMFASGALVAFVAFLLYGGISEVSEMMISVGAFAVSWLGVSFFIKNFLYVFNIFDQHIKLIYF